MLLTYHQIEAEPSGQVYGVTAPELQRHLAMIAGRQLDRGVQGHVVSFDDGHISNFERALPLLEQRKLAAVFFIPAGFVGTRPEVMTWSQLRELVSMGHEVASHSWSHPILTQCSRIQLMEELSRSRATLEDKLGRLITSISMPHGSWNYEVIQACSQVGYRRVYTSDFRIGDKTLADVEVLGRLTVRRGMTVYDIERFLDARGISFWWLAAPYLAKDTLKSILGETIYHKLWKSTMARRAKTRSGAELGGGQASGGAEAQP